MEGQGETPKFNSGNEKDSGINSPILSFYSLLMKSYEKKTELLLKREVKRHLSAFTKSNKKKKNFSPVKKRTRNDVSEPKGQFAKFLVKRFQLRNDYDRQHSEEFLVSKEQAFEFPSKDDDIID